MQDLKFMASNSAIGKVALHPGLNVTVRKGEKWLETTLGEELNIVVTETGEGIARGRVISAFFVRDLGEIPEFILGFEHEPACRTLSDLRGVLLETYGANFSAEGYTVLMFWV